MVLNAAVRIGTVRQIIFLGGREVSAHEGYAAYTCANGAMWALVQLVARHIETVLVYYVDLPLVEGSTMANRYLTDPAKKDLRDGVVSIEEIAVTINSILAGNRASGCRIVLGEAWKI